MRLETVMSINTDREALFDWMECTCNARGDAVRVDTWEFTNHPMPSGEMVTLYAITLVYATPDPPADKPLSWAERLHGIDGF